MIQRILLKNRQLLRIIQPTLLLMGCGFMAIFGAMIISANNTLEIDVSAFPNWLGYVFCYGAFIALCMIGVDTIYRLAFMLRKRASTNISEIATRFKLRFQNRARDDSLLARIRECEK